MKPSEEFRVEHSPSGDTVMVHSQRAITILLRGPVAERLEDVAQERRISVSRLLEEIIEQQIGSSTSITDRKSDQT